MKAWSKTKCTKWIIEWCPCGAAVKWWDWSELHPIRLIEKLIAADKLDWANWAMARLLGKRDRIRYAIYAAEKVLAIHEQKYPTDDRPRKAIEAAKNYLESPTEKNRAAVFAEGVVGGVGGAFAFAAAAAAYAADADAAADAAETAAAYADRKQMKIDILRYGIKLLEAAK